MRGSGREYQRLEAIAETVQAIILPVNFPKPPNVATVEAARDATLSELMHWHFAPENAKRLVTITAFLERVRTRLYILDRHIMQAVESVGMLAAAGALMMLERSEDPRAFARLLGSG